MRIYLDDLVKDLTTDTLFMENIKYIQDTFLTGIKVALKEYTNRKQIEFDKI